LFKEVLIEGNENGCSPPTIFIYRIFIFLGKGVRP